MEKKTPENVIVPFYTKKRDGTGLGITIAEKVIEGYQGKIHINSKLKQGTEIA